MDGSQKLPQRLLGTIRDRLREGAAIGRLALGVAAWMRYVTGVDEKGAPIDVRDPMAARLRELADPGRGLAPSAWQRSCSLCAKFSGTIFPRIRASLAL